MSGASFQNRQYTFLFQGIVFPRERNHRKNFLWAIISERHIPKNWFQLYRTIVTQCRKSYDDTAWKVPKCGPEKTRYLDTFHVVQKMKDFVKNLCPGYTLLWILLFSWLRGSFYFQFLFKLTGSFTFKSAETLRFP